MPVTPPVRALPLAATAFISSIPAGFSCQQVIAQGRLGWSLRRIQRVTKFRRETAAVYLREAGVAVRPPGLWGHGSASPAKEPVADLLSATATGTDAGPPPAKPAIEVTTDFGAELATSAGSCQAHPLADGTTGALPAATANRCSVRGMFSGLEVRVLRRATSSPGASPSNCGTPPARGRLADRSARARPRWNRWRWPSALPPHPYR